MKRNMTMLLAAALLVACNRDKVSEPVPTDVCAVEWYQSDSVLSADKVDVLYLISTEVLSAQDSSGQETWRAQLTESDRKAMTGEMAWVGKHMFQDDYNLLSPYYHQFTFDAILKLNDADYKAVYQEVSEEVCDAFDYYMAHINQGRPYVLAGFSQGAMLTLDVLRHMTDEQYEQMVACYSIGYRLSNADLEHQHIKAAEGESDYGVVVSFNSTQTREAIWPLVSEGACTCINPMNWKTDATPATFEFEGTTNTVYVDQEEQVLLVTTDQPEHYYEFMDAVPVFGQAGASRDNLHHWDLLFYAQQIHDNALVRASRMKRQ